jgi:hypothetical protein
MQTGVNDGLWLKDANLQPHVFDPLLTHGSQPRLWLKDRAQVTIVLARPRVWGSGHLLAIQS